MISEWMKVLLSEDYDIGGMDSNSRNANFYDRQKRDLDLRAVGSINAKVLIGKIKKSNRFNLFIDELSGIKQSVIYKSDCHGLNHNERVSLFSFYLANRAFLSDEELKLALYAAFYHDIGRIDDCTDDEHGKRSADMLDKVLPHLSEEDMNILKTVITCHSLDDEEFDGVAKKNNVKKITKCKKLFCILKDSDALDRVRLVYPIVVPSMLRDDKSREIILAAYQLYDNYEKIVENRTEKSL